MFLDYPIWGKSRKSDTPLFRFVVRERNGAGYIDRDGKVVIEPNLTQFGNHGGDFFDGLALVHVKGESWYIDATGRRLFRAPGGTDFSERLAVGSKEGRCGYIDRRGQFVIAPSFDAADSFSEGLAAVSLKGRWGYIGKHGAFAVAPTYALAEPFSDGVARVIESGPCLYLGYGPCDRFVPEILPHDLQRRQTPEPPRCRYSFIDRTGKKLFANEYPDAKEFAEGLAPVGDGKHWGFVNKKGALTIPLRFDNAEPFSEHLARVRLDNKWGFIDRSGKWIIAPKLDNALDFSEGLAAVSDGTKWSYIDRTGRAVFTYSDRSPH